MFMINPWVEEAKKMKIYCDECKHLKSFFLFDFFGFWQSFKENPLQKKLIRVLKLSQTEEKNCKIDIEI